MSKFSRWLRQPSANWDALEIVANTIGGIAALLLAIQSWKLVGSGALIGILLWTRHAYRYDWLIGIDQYNRLARFLIEAQKNYDPPWGSAQLKEEKPDEHLPPKA